MVIILVIVALIFIATISFFQMPSFGKKPTGKRLEALQQLPNYKEGTFQNQSVTPPLTGDTTMGKVMVDFLFGKHPGKTPSRPIPFIKRDLKNPDKTLAQLTWFGHSSYLLQIDGITILVDPVFSERTSPVQFAGTKAFSGSNEYKAADIPDIDILLITHDHYDHLDYGTIHQLKNRVSVIVTSSGVGAHLERWGIAPEKIKELNWWESIQLPVGATFTATPGRHFSGRTFKRNETLWSSFVLELRDRRLFLGGDSGYDDHFKEIGKRFGFFDMAILECGQYNVSWANIHMMPEETAQAAIDLNAKVLFPVHWGKFALATHTWDDSIKRVTIAAQALQQPIITPMIGQQVLLDGGQTYDKWWEQV